MMKKFLFVLISILSVVLYACNKDDIDNPSEAVDSYEGEFKKFSLTNQLESFEEERFICVISTSDGSIITREGSHKRSDEVSNLTLDVGLADGTYRFLALRYEVEESRGVTGVNYAEFGLGFRIEVSSSGEFTILDSYNSTMGFFGAGVDNDPYYISSYEHLVRLRMLVDTEVTNEYLTSDICFQQTADLDMAYASWDSDNVYGWISIGSVPNCPFKGQYDGGGHTISNLWIDRPSSAGVGLFGFVEGAVLTNIKIDSPSIEGHFGVGGLVGGVVSPGDDVLSAVITGCSLTNGTIVGSSEGIGVGGLIGVVDMKSKLLVDNCNNVSTAISGATGVGGLVGGGVAGSSVVITSSSNSANIQSTNTGAGGLIGAVDSLSILNCYNKGNVTGSTRKTNSDTEACFGTGGLVGGSGPAQIVTSYNEGDVSGYIGVGGIAGSSRISDDMTFNNILVKAAYNKGRITGESSVGGICGEAQLGGYALLNEGTITAEGESNSHVGGICGVGSLSVIYNAVNGGSVSTKCTDGGTIGGIISKSDWGTLLTCQNYGDISGGAYHMGGVVALAGNYSMMNYCSNAGALTSSNTSGIVGGVVGELGDQREWSGENIAACVLGAFDVLMGVVGAGLLIIEDVAGVIVGAAETAMKVIHFSEITGDIIITLGDTVLTSIGVAEMLNEEDFDLMKVNLSADMSNNYEVIKDMVDDYRTNYSIVSQYLQSGINSLALRNFTNNTTAVNTFLGASEDNNDLINNNFTIKREDRLEDLESDKELQEIIQKVVAGVCIAVTTITMITSAIVTGGISTAASAVLVPTAIVSGVNSIVEGATDFQDNVAIVSQCANYGAINARNTAHTSGVVAIANDNCWVRDCLNSGPNTSGLTTSGNSIIGSDGTNVIVENSLLLGANWPSSKPSNSCVLYKESSSGSYDDNYAYSLSDLIDISRYNSLGWDITSADGSSESLWIVPSYTGEFPVPYFSEMQRELE